MNRKSLLMFIIMASFVLLASLLIILVYFNYNINKNSNNQVSGYTEEKTVKDVIEQYESEYIETNSNYIYVNFIKDLYNTDGSSNEDYFNALIRDLKPFFDKKSFYVVDEEKKIVIHVVYDSSVNGHKTIINNVEDFFKKVKGQDYVFAETSQIVPKKNIYIEDDILIDLMINDTYFSHIKDRLGEPKELNDGYTSYLDDKIRIRLSPIKTVRNIIFSKDYDEYLVDKVKPGMSLRDIEKIYPEPSFGSANDRYLGYRVEDFYIFFYPDEVSVYSYTYESNEKFEKLLDNYLQSYNLDEFIEGISNQYKVYDKLEYDKEKQTAYVLFANRGIEINISKDDPNGIILYSNYRFSDKVKEQIKSGRIKVDTKDDLLDKTERQRRNSKKVEE